MLRVRVQVLAPAGQACCWRSKDAAASSRDVSRAHGCQPAASPHPPSHLRS
jgi:hypothetical protein